MLIGICGGICSGKKTVAQYLVEHHGFKRLHLTGPGQGSSRSTSELGNPGPSSPSPPPAALAGALTTGSDGLQSVSDSSLPLRPQQELSGGRSGNGSSLCFATAEALLEFVTTRWQARFVTTDIPTEAALDVLLRRPFFLLLSVDAPLTVRWRRFQLRCGDSSAAISLEDFVARSDAHLYDPDGGLQPLISRASVRLLNTSSSLAHLYATLGKLDIPNPDRLRPGWDTYFMALASLAAQRSNCMKRRVGCVLVGRERRVISTGYNGTPRGIRNCTDGGCPRCNAGHGSGVGLATCLCIHAEENALLEAGRERIRDGAVLYCDTCPCLTCSIKICQVGISEVVYAHGYSMDKETAAVFSQAGVKLRQFVPPPNGLIHLEKMELY
ncbi:cytidine and deoxycytidylate deaminase zinc-binding domain-containing protein [Hirsutella rhossiliensis]|uniref:Deoxycytidylate deaminase n=1 Tax=Hirsutella rhossiliensis TaxID=111463 RepID=A0A9P8SG43_9HYPO|nr:cytidine and deoxycytidylate deaminase zinc-binding domain-containing protein [Hirsutella rhossiliensis]KAH0959661.1 cytidine and deoxycytidylate deaminase zinc-binding domain-containing protein [Hirsutella rhossiliensis]